MSPQEDYNLGETVHLRHLLFSNKIPRCVTTWHFSQLRILNRAVASNPANNRTAEKSVFRAGDNHGD
jgi:hypothetical protein